MALDPVDSDKPAVTQRPIRIWERVDPVSLPFCVVWAILRRIIETVRLAYWRRILGWEIGPGVRVHLTARIPRCVKVVLKEGASISQGVRFVAEYNGGELYVGESASIAQFSVLDVTGRLIIESGATISEGAVLYTHSHGRDPRNPAVAHTLTIGEKAWICARAMVLCSAKKVGDRAIVGPYCVVRREVAPDSVVSAQDSVDPNPAVNQFKKP